MTTINITTSTTSTTDPNHHHHHHNNNTTGNSNSSKWTTCTASDINVYDSNQNIESSSSSSSSSFSSSSSSTTGNHNCNVLPVYTIIWPGLGLLGESYILFSIGTLYPIWEYIILFSTTNGSNSNDDDTTTTTTDSSSSNTSNTTLSLLHQLPYLTCISIICGMIFFGIYTHYIGRRYGSITTAFFMCCGCCIMTLLTIIPQIILLRRRSYNVFDAQQQYIQQFNYHYQYYWYIFGIGMILFAFGVGGEYPVAAASATEQSMRIRRRRRSHMSCHHMNNNNNNNNNNNSTNNNSANTKVQQPQSQQQPQESSSPSKAPHETSFPSQSHTQLLLPHKSGQHIQYIFSMQGVGILLQVIILTILLFYFYQLNNNTDDSIIIYGYTIIWLIIYMIGTLILLTVFITRVLHLKESIIWQQQQQQQQQQQKESQPQQQHDGLNIDILHATHNDTTNDTWNFKDDSIPNKNKCNNNNNNNNNASVDHLHHHLYWKDNSGASSTTPHDNDVDLTQEQHLISSDHIPQSTTATATATTKNIHWTILIQILLLNSPYGLRLLGVSLSWFLWDVAFYGNKLFQSTFLLALTNNTNNDTNNTNDEYSDNSNNDPDYTNNSKYGIESILRLSIAATINASIALCGYYTAAHIIDHPFLGRQSLQFYGFIITGSLFVSVGYFYDTLPTNVLIIMYFGTSFFGQCGPNATTFILPSEVFPTQLRTICHGAAAASGKLGALVATIVFNRLSNQVDLFLLSGYTSFIAAAVTYWFVPETVGHDLRENDSHWEYIVRSYLDHSTIESTGFFQNPSFLSVYERRRTLRNHNNINSDCEHQYKQYDEAFQLS